ncbi:MAG: hypothetical protein ABI587_15710 [Gemmatimonadales bacterium]
MGRLFGRVLVKETNAGIPNLVISAFDQDPAARGDAAGVDRRRQQQGIDGARLGSVLTGPGGTFELEYDIWMKGHPGSEIRPDILLAVFAPEDSAGLQDPKPRPPEQRILHVSRVPRVDASPIEGYVIRILRAQLEELGIPFLSEVTGRSARDDADLLAGSIERTWAMRDAVRERLQPRLEREAKRDETRREKAKHWARSLNLTSKPQRDHPLFAPDADSAVQAQERAMKEGFARLKSYKPQLRLNLTEADLEAMGLKKSANGVEGKVTFATLNARVFAGSGGLDLVRRRDLDDVLLTPERRLAAIRKQLKPRPEATAMTEAPALARQAKGGST